MSTNVHIIYHDNLDWLFHNKYSEKIGISIIGFEFIFPNLKNSLKKFIEPSSTLINSEFGQKETTTAPTRDTFSPKYKGIEDNIKNYKNTPTTHINENYFLYDKSNLIKDTFITPLTKKILIYGSISYFNKKKTENKIFKIVPLEEFLKFYVDKDVTWKSLGFKLTNKRGDLPKLKDSKIYNVFLTRIGEKRKRKMAEPIETVIVRTQQNFDITSGLKPMQIEIEHDRVLNIFKKHEKAAYKLFPLEMLFAASIKNDTEQIFVTCRKPNDVKKSLINSKIYGLLGMIDLKKLIIGTKL